MKWILIFSLVLSGCATQPLPDNSYQVKASEIIAKYNATHGLNLPVPVVNIGPTTELSYANDWCPHYVCFITLNSVYISEKPDYMMDNILPHEIAHHICILTIPGCTPNDHGTAWQKIAVEVGVPEDDGYIKIHH